LKVFLDTNVLVSAFIARGLCADIFRLILSKHELVLCTHVLKELEDILKSKINLPTDQISAILSYLKTFKIVTEHQPPMKIELSDKNDIPVISAALNSKADILVSGDKDLLEVSGQYGLKIVDPRSFFKLLKGLEKSE
jgi:putative PIN family toxin of toxin-antitoxin system